MFLLVSGRHVGAHPDGHQHGVSVQSSVNLSNTLLRIAREWKIAETLFLARLFILQLSIISQILESIYWTVTIFSSDHMTDENRVLAHLTRLDQSRASESIWWIMNKNNYSPKWRWLVVDIYRAAKRRGKYPTQATDTEVNSCFSIY